MCGIAGAWAPGLQGVDWLKAALDAMLHRGPDSEGMSAEAPGFLGARRLAIIDVENGAQPLRNEDGSVAVVLNGEIYNHVELIQELKAKGHRFRTRSDTEVLAHLYEEEGEGLCRRLRGMFAFALYDRSRQKLLLARDRFGKKPLYLTRLPDGSLLFASEIKSLRAACNVLKKPLKIATEGLWDFLSLGYIPQPGTAFEGVQVLPPASVLTIDREGERTSTYWTLSYAAKRPEPLPDLLEELRRRIAESVRIRMRSDVGVGVFLSGGVDSTIVAYEAARISDVPLQAFTISSVRAGYDESGAAARTARAFGLKHTIIPLSIDPLEATRRMVRHYDQPYADSSAIPSMALAAAAAPSIKVALVGDGGDELFGGYRRYLTAFLPRWIPALPAALAEGLAGVIGRLSPGRRSTWEFLSRAASGLGEGRGGRFLAWTSNLLRDAEKRSLWRGTPLRSTEAWLDGVLPQETDRIDAFMHADISVGLLSDLLVKMDMATMAYSIEARSPLLDQEVAEFAASLHGSRHVSMQGLKQVLRQAYQGRIPEEILRAPKRGFEIPMKDWLDGPLKLTLDGILHDPRSRIYDYLDPVRLKRFLASARFKTRNRSALLFSLLVLDLWLRDRS